MNKKLLSVTLAIVSLLARQAEAQAPASFRGATIYLSGYDSVVTVANGANSYQKVNWITGVSGSGSFTYAQSNSDAILAVTDNNLGAFSADYTFTSASGGTYAFTHTASAPPFQTGEFSYYSGTAPTAAALVGTQVTGTITSGNTNSDSSGTFSVAFVSPTLANVIDTDGILHSETYSVSTVNQSTIKINTTLPGLNSASLYLSYADTGGAFIVHSLTGGWQIGTFTTQAGPDITRPTLTISSPVANAHLSNQVATVTGTAHDNVAVSSVYVSTDNLTWTVANGSTNWSASVNLSPGTNTIWAYAVDTSGNVSITNKVNVTYVVSAVLTVQINQAGWGTVTPNDNNASLQVGNIYTLTAAAKPGFAFTNWTDGGGNILTNRPALKFTMTGGLVFVANFVDIAKPTLSITNIPLNGNWSNSQFTVRGKTADNVGVANVFYKVNSNAWSSGVSSANNLTNWYAVVTLTPGPNTIAAYAQDAAGNVSATNVVRLNFILSAPLLVGTNGRGTVSPNYNNASLQIGSPYTMTATPAPGFGFTRWTDGGSNVVGTNRVLTFTMASNLVFTANFVDVQKPTLTILTPTAATSASNQMFIARGTAADNVGATSVYFKFNQGNWYPASTTNLNYYTNWYEVLQLVPGTNYFAAYAVDAAGNSSPTNTIKFVYTTAPASLNGVIGGITPATAGPTANFISVGGALPTQFVAFGATTFSQWAGDTNGGDNGVGSYTYTKQSPSSGQLKITYTAPPSATNADGAQTILLTFSAPQVATFTNVSSGDAGGIVFTSTPTLVPTSLVNQKVAHVSEPDNAGIVYFTANQAINETLQQTTNGVKSYTYVNYSPVSGLLKESSSNGVTYTVLTFQGTNYGTSYSEDHTAAGNLTSVNLGWIGLVSQKPGGNAPNNLAGRSLVVTTDTGANQLNFVDGSNFTDVNPQDNSIGNGSGTYVYGPPSTNNASLNLNYNGAAAVSYQFQFVSPNFAVFTNSVDGTLGTAVLK